MYSTTTYELTGTGSTGAGMRLSGTIIIRLFKWLFRWLFCALMLVLLNVSSGHSPSAPKQSAIPDTQPCLETSRQQLPRPLSAGEQTTLLRRCKQRLPKLEPLFKQVADQHQMDWVLLAAIAYQESHWYPKAKSPTGVRGLMMLTRQTAKEVGIHNRLDPEQSLRGGVHYLKKLHLRLPEEIHEPDRTWMALAAYNVGYGHLQDARKIATRKGLNPNSWQEVMTVLPLLEDPHWHGSTRYGYARGREPVKYVEQIRSFTLALNQLPAASKPSSLLAAGGKTR